MEHEAHNPNVDNLREKFVATVDSKETVLPVDCPTLVSEDIPVGENIGDYGNTGVGKGKSKVSEEKSKSWANITKNANVPKMMSSNLTGLVIN